MRFALSLLLFFTLGLRADPPLAAHPEIVIMLDVDDTLLNLADHKRYADSPKAQAIEYVPEGNVKLYNFKDHYVSLGEGRLQSRVAVRPGMAPFFEKMAPLIASGKVRIVLTSLNDNARTKAVQEQLRVGGKTLKQWGVETATVATFLDFPRSKDFGVFRKNMRLDPDTKVIAIDDNPTVFGRQGANDKLVVVPAFDLAHADFYLDNVKYKKKAEVEGGFDGLFDRVMKISSTGGNVCHFEPLAQ